MDRRQKIYLPAIHGPGSLRAAHAGSVTATMQDLPLMVLSNPIIYTKTVASQIYVRQEEAGTSALRLLYQGTLVAPVSDEFLGASALWGVQTTDQVITYIDQYAAREQSGAEIHAGGRFIGTDAAGNAIMDVVADPQQASLDLHYTMESSSAHELGRLTAVELRLTHAEAEAPPTATLCLPDAESQCVRKEMAGETTNWSTTFAAVEFAGSEQEAADAELPLYGVVEIEIPGHSTITRWFRDNGGVGTGHMVGTTPQREGRVMVNTLSVPPTFMPDYCNRVMVMPATSYAALKTPMEFVLVGYPLDLDVLFGLPDNQACQSEDQLVGRRLPAGVTSRLTLSYAEEQVTYLGVNETQLQIFRLTSNGWEPMNSDTLVDTTLNLVTAVIDTDGIYAIGWEQR